MTSYYHAPRIEPTLHSRATKPVQGARHIKKCRRFAPASPPTDVTVLRDALRRDPGRKTVHEVAAVCLRPEAAVNQRTDRPAFPNCSSSRTPQLGKLVRARAMQNSFPLQGRGCRRCSGEARSRPNLQRTTAIIVGRNERASRTASAEHGESKRRRCPIRSREGTSSRIGSWISYGRKACFRKSICPPRMAGDFTVRVK